MLYYSRHKYTLETYYFYDQGRRSKGLYLQAWAIHKKSYILKSREIEEGVEIMPRTFHYASNQRCLCKIYGIMYLTIPIQFHLIAPAKETSEIAMTTQ